MSATKTLWWARRAALAFVGGAVALAGALKLANPASFAESIHNYRIVSPLWSGLLAVYVPWLELVLVAGLCRSRTRRVAWALLALLLAAFTIILLITWLRGIDVRCGCFGGGAGQGPTPGWAVLRNLVLLGLLGFGRKATTSALPV